MIHIRLAFARWLLQSLASQSLAFVRGGFSAAASSSRRLRALYKHWLIFALLLLLIKIYAYDILLICFGSAYLLLFRLL